MYKFLVSLLLCMLVLVSAVQSSENPTAVDLNPSGMDVLLNRDTRAAKKGKKAKNPARHSGLFKHLQHLKFNSKLGQN